MYNTLLEKKGSIAVIGLGYVGLPLALELAKSFKVTGFDINERNLELLRKGEDPCKELPKEAFLNSDIIFTSNPAELDKASFYIVAVPTPIVRSSRSLKERICSCRSIFYMRCHD